MSGLDLDAVDFSQVKLTGAKIKRTNLRNCRFSEANITNMNLNGALLFGTSFWQAELINANFSFAVLTDGRSYPRGDHWSTKIRNYIWGLAVMTDGKTYGESDLSTQLYAPLLNQPSFVNYKPREWRYTLQPRSTC